MAFMVLIAFMGFMAIIAFIAFMDLMSIAGTDAHAGTAVLARIAEHE